MVIRIYLFNPTYIAEALRPFLYRCYRLWFWPNILRSRTNQSIIAPLFNDMGSPAGYTRHHEDRCEHRRGNTAQMISGGTIEI